MNKLQRLVSERRASESDPSLMGLFRLVTGLDGKIEAANVEVRQLAAGFGTRHARAAVEWTDRVVQYEDKQVGSAPNAALLEQRVLLFDECVADAVGGGDVVKLESSRCDELQMALQALYELREVRDLATARATTPSKLDWSSGDPMPERLASWGCDEKLWEAVKDKRAIVRLANTAGGEVRCRRRLENLRKLVEAAEADKRAVERAARRAARKASDAKDAAVIAAVAAEEAAARRAARRAARQQTAATAPEEEAEEAEKEGDDAIPWLLQEPQRARGSRSGSRGGRRSTRRSSVRICRLWSCVESGRRRSIGKRSRRSLSSGAAMRRSGVWSRIRMRCGSSRGMATRSTEGGGLRI